MPTDQDLFPEGRPWSDATANYISSFEHAIQWLVQCRDQKFSDRFYTRVRKGARP